jgi:hypothetical protein
MVYLVEEGKGLLELGDLVVCELVLHVSGRSKGARTLIVLCDGEEVRKDRLL